MTRNLLLVSKPSKNHICYMEVIPLKHQEPEKKTQSPKIHKNKDSDQLNPSPEAIKPQLWNTIEKEKTEIKEEKHFT